MKRFLFFAVLVLILGAVAMEMMRHDPGYLLIRVGGKALETTFWMALLTVTFIIVVSTLLVYFVTKLWRLIKGSFGFFSLRKEKKIEAKTKRGMINYIEGNWQEAQKDLKGVAQSSDQPLVPYLAAAQSAYELGDIDETRRLLSEAEKHAPDNDLAVGISQARIDLADKKYEQCLATLKRVYEPSQPHPVVLALLKDVLIEVKDWEALKVLLPQLKSNKIAKDHEALEVKVYRESFAKGVEVLESNDGLTKLEQLFRSLPKSLRLDSKIVLVYCRKLFELGDIRDSANHIQKALKKTWSNDLVELYASLKGGDDERRLKVAQAWSKKRSDDHFLLNMLGRMSANLGSVEQASSYFEQSLKIKETSTTYADFGLLLAGAGEYQRSTEYFEKGLCLHS